MICEAAGGYEEDPFDLRPPGVEQEVLINLSNGTPLELKDGYELDVQSVDIDGNKVYLELLKEGQVVDSQVIVAANEVTDTFVYIKPGTMQKIKVHFRNAFRGADKNLVSLDHIEQTSEIYPHRLLLTDTQLQTISSETALKLEEGYYLALKSLDIDGNKAYLELLKDGQVIYSQVIIAANEADGTYIYSKPGTMQKIMAHFKNAFRGADQNLVSMDHIEQTSEIYPHGNVLNDSSYWIITSGTPLILDEGYELQIASIDIDGNKAYIELHKDGVLVDSQVIIAANEVDDTFVYSKPGTAQKIEVHFKNAFRGANQNLVTEDHILQTSEIDPSLILINDSSCRTVTAGAPLELDEGYELAIQSVDIDGNKVYVELFKDGQLVYSQVIIAPNEVDDIFVYSKPGRSRTMLHVKNVYRGADQNIITVDRIQQNSETNSSLILINNSSQWAIPLGIPLGLQEGYEVVVASVDIGGNKAYIELFKDGQLVYSQVVIAANKVDSFVYSSPETAEKIEVHFKNAFRGVDRNLVSVDHVEQVSGIYPYLILINDSSLRIFDPGTPLKLKEGYELAIQSVDIDGNKAYVELSKDEYVIDSRIIIAANEVDDTYVYTEPETGQKLAVHFKNAYRSAIVNLATVDSISQ